MQHARLVGVRCWAIIAIAPLRAGPPLTITSGMLPKSADLMRRNDIHRTYLLEVAS